MQMKEFFQKIVSLSFNDRNMYEFDHRHHKMFCSVVQCAKF
jgi:hypothetical protein